MLAVILIIAPLFAYLGERLDWWTFNYQWDILAHSSVSLGLALGLGLALKKLRVDPSYTFILIPVILMGISWEIGELLLRESLEIRYVNVFETFKDITMDSVGALIGAIIIVRNKRG